MSVLNIGSGSQISAFLQWALAPETQIAVWLPLLVSIYFLIEDKSWRKKEIILCWILATFTTFYFASWSQRDDFIGLNLFPFFIAYPIMTALSRQEKIPAQWNLEKLGFVGLCYFSILLPDVFKGFLHEGISETGFHLGLFRGIGGDGIKDALFIAPIAAYVLYTVVFAYIAYHLKKTRT